MRQLAAKFLRRTHLSPQRFSSSSEITISNALPNSLSSMYFLVFLTFFFLSSLTAMLLIYKLTF